jgi:hypothetical protein
MKEAGMGQQVAQHPNFWAMMKKLLLLLFLLLLQANYTDRATAACRQS